MIEITQLMPADRATWQALWHDYMVFYDRVLDLAQYDRAWSAFMADSRMHARGARIDGRLVGIVHFLVHANTSADDVCYLQDLFTAADVRGQGVGRALIDAVTKFARERSCARVYWMTQESNAPARRLYDQVAVNRGFIRYDIPLSS